MDIFSRVGKTANSCGYGQDKKKLPNDDYKKLLAIVAEIDATAEATGYHSSNPEPFSTKNDAAWEALNDFCKERFEGVV